MNKAFFVFFSNLTFGHGIAESSKREMIEGNFLEYIWLGAEHMLTGYDHLLFLFGVIFFLKNFKDIVTFISVFTLGHSITLIFATFLGITANYFLIDAVIALSVCYKGFDNNNGFVDSFKMKRAPNILVAVFIFGLIHGFGLSTRLQQLPLGDKNIEMLGKILSFNLGVELGQIGALSLMLIFLSVFRKSESFGRLSRFFNHGLIFSGFLLFLMQMHGYMHNVYSEDFKPHKEHRAKKAKEGKHNHDEDHGHGGPHHGHGHNHKHEVL